MQTKLKVNAPGDSYECEADRIADQALAAPANARVTKGPMQLQRFSGQSSGQPDMAPSSVDQALASPGNPLEPAVREDMETRFGYDFSHVHVHSGSAAEESARDLNAHAYTLGSSIVFGTSQYAPQTQAGRHLLAHELAHVMQQDRAPALAIQRACRSAAQCRVPSPGNAGEFGRRVEAESENIARASGGVPVGGHVSCNLPRHGQRATNFETLATTAGLGATIAPGIDGFFINACLSRNDGGNNAPCSEFPGGPPAGTNPAHSCVQVHTFDEDKATALLAKPRPLGDADLRDFLSITATVTHESQHNRFDANAGTIVPPAADCNVNTPVPLAGGTPVESLLSEISAEIAEFDVYFKNFSTNPSRASNLAMQSEEHDIATRGSENILDNIKDVQCVCECRTVDRFVENVFNQASASWTPAEQTEFKKAMTGFIPSFWPRSLHQR